MSNIPDVNQYSEWVGKSFYKWCEENEDDRKIYYVLLYMSGNERVKTERFTSEDTIGPTTMVALTESEIADIRVDNNELYITLHNYNPINAGFKELKF